MSNVKWIKITTTMFDDEKIRLIESMPEKDTILVIWIKLLALCGKCNHDGKIMLSGDIAYTDEMLSSLFNRPVNSIRLALEIFNKFKMIEIQNGTIEIVNWYKHQSVEGLEKIKEQTRLRVERYRQKKSNNIDNNINTIIDSNMNNDISIKHKKENKNKRDNVTVTLRNVTDIPPLLETVKEYCIKRNNGVDVEKWWNFYASKGWMIGKNKMKDWQAAIRTWEKSPNQQAFDKKIGGLRAFN